MHYTTENGETLVQIYNQDHTLGVMLRIPLDADPRVISNGYKQRKPFDDFVALVITTTDTIDAQTAIRDASHTLLKHIHCFETLVFEALF